MAGSLVICGGGKLPDLVLNRFIDLAGGPLARIVVITTASEFADSPQADVLVEFWKRQQLAGFNVLHTRSRDTANDPKFSAPLHEATGVWFTGGAQDRVTEAYLGTKFEEPLRDVLKRGGVIGGTSAGAAIMSPVMIVGGKQQAEVGKGFGFVPGTVIDQHFIKRNRQERLLGVLSAHPGLLGLGIDEGTAMIIQGGRLSVLGESKVMVFIPPSQDEPVQIQSLASGEEADLVVLRRTASGRVQLKPQIAKEKEETPVSVAKDDKPAPVVPAAPIATTTVEEPIQVVKEEKEQPKAEEPQEVAQVASTDVMDETPEGGTAPEDEPEEAPVLEPAAQ
jgi:cyanophycinase